MAQSNAYDPIGMLKSRDGTDAFSGKVGDVHLVDCNGEDLLGCGIAADTPDDSARENTLMGDARADWSDGRRDTIMDFGSLDRLVLDAMLVAGASLGRFETTFGSGDDVLVFARHDALASNMDQIELI